MPMEHQFINSGEAAFLQGRPGVIYEERDGLQRQYRWRQGEMQPLGDGAAGLSVDNITGLPAVDSTLPLIVPGVQGAAMGQTTFRPSNVFADWPTLLATPSQQAWDRHILVPGVLSNMRPIEVMHDGTRFVPLGVCDWNYTSLHDSDANIVRRTTAGAFALAVALGGSTLLVPTPANCLRVKSHCEGELIIRRTGTNAASTVPVQLRFGKTPSAIIGTDNIAVNNAGEGRFVWSFGITGATTVYTSAFSGIGASQTLPNEVSSADIDLASIMGLGVYLNGADGDNTFAVQSLRVKWFI